MCGKHEWNHIIRTFYSTKSFGFPTCSIRLGTNQITLSGFITLSGNYYIIAFYKVVTEGRNILYSYTCSHGTAPLDVDIVISAKTFLFQPVTLWYFNIKYCIVADVGPLAAYGAVTVTALHSKGGLWIL